MKKKLLEIRERLKTFNRNPKFPLLYEMLTFSLYKWNFPHAIEQFSQTNKIHLHISVIFIHKILQTANDIHFFFFFHVHGKLFIGNCNAVVESTASERECQVQLSSSHWH